MATTFPSIPRIRTSERVSPAMVPASASSTIALTPAQPTIDAEPETPANATAIGGLDVDESAPSLLTGVGYRARTGHRPHENVAFGAEQHRLLAREVGCRGDQTLCFDPVFPIQGGR